MKSAVCTLFEKHYHFGLAVLVNSLYHNGFRGDVYVGYRGELPAWTSAVVDNPSLNWNNAKTLNVKDGVQIHFLPVDIDYQFTNYKPNFMLRLFDGPCKDVDALAYLDPDIVIKCKWSFFETWMSHGVAMVHEIISNDMPATHPIRREWEKVVAKCDRKVTRNLNSYINAGFCGVIREHMEFLILWQYIMEVAKTHFNMEATNFMFTDTRIDIFFAKDQDAMNIAAMCSDSPISEMGPEAMDFVNGGFTMAHAVGVAKPWKKKFISSALRGIPPGSADKAFWSNAHGPLQPYTSFQLKTKKISLGLSSLIGRFYGRN